MSINKNSQNKTNYYKSIGRKKSFKVFLINNFKAFLFTIFFAISCVFFSEKIWAQLESLYNVSNDFSGISTLMSATSDGDIEGVRFFSKAGAIAINKRNRGGATALHIACRDGNFEIVKILIDNGANVNIADNEGWTPLMRASLNGNSAIVEYLLQNGARAHQTNNLNESALIHATSSRCLNCLVHLIEKGDLAKNMDTLSLKSQVADSFVIARNLENEPIQNLLGSFLDYLSKITPLTIPKHSQYSDDLPDVNNYNPPQESASQNKNNRNFDKKYTLKNDELNQSYPEDNSKYHFVEDPKNSNQLNQAKTYFMPNKQPLNQTPVPKNSKVYKFIKTLDNSNNPNPNITNSTIKNKDLPKINYTPVENIKGNINGNIKGKNIIKADEFEPFQSILLKPLSPNISKPKTFKFRVGKAPIDKNQDEKEVKKNGELKEIKSNINLKIPSKNFDKKQLQQNFNLTPKDNTQKPKLKIFKFKEGQQSQNNNKGKGDSKIEKTLLKDNSEALQNSGDNKSNNPKDNQENSKDINRYKLKSLKDNQSPLKTNVNGQDVNGQNESSLKKKNNKFEIINQQDSQQEKQQNQYQDPKQNSIEKKELNESNSYRIKNKYSVKQQFDKDKFNNLNQPIFSEEISDDDFIQKSNNGSIADHQNTIIEPIQKNEIKLDTTQI